MSNDLRFRLNAADVIFERFDEEVVAIQLATGAYHSISGAGMDAFLLLPSEPTIAEIAQALSEKYAACASDIEKDLGPFFEKLRAESIVLTREGEGGRGQRLDLSQSGQRLPYPAAAIQPYRDLQELFLLDPVHDVGPVGWPQAKPDPATTPEVRYRLRDASAVIFERLDDETVAMNLGTGAYHGLAGPAEDIFLLLGEEPTLPEIVTALRSKYNAPDGELAEASGQFLASLIRAGLAGQTEVGAAAGTRQLQLAKPGAGVPFVKPHLESFQDRTTPVAVRAEHADRSPLEFARKQFRVPECGVVSRMAGREAVVINFEAGSYYLLNSTASTVFRLLGQQPTATQLVDALGRVYDWNRRQLTVAVLGFLHNLAAEGLVTVEEATNGTRHLEVAAPAVREPFEPFSVEAHRELRHLFLPFPGTTNDRSEPSWKGRELVSLLTGYHREVACGGGQSEAVFAIAGQRVRVRCAAGMRVPEFQLAFGHLETVLPPDSPADLTIHVWDCVSGGAPTNSFLSLFLSDLHARWCELCGPRGEVLAFHSPELPVLYHAGPDILSVIDTENHTAYYLKRDDSPLPYWEVGSPFRTILHFWLSTQGLQFVHGGAVGDERGGVLLAGKGGAGKSTTALACLNAGMSYAGDDYCAVELLGVPFLHSLYNTAKLKGTKDLDRFPHLREHVWNPECFTNNNGDKATFFLAKSWADHVSSGFPLRAVLVPQITGERDTRIGDCSEAQALASLSASTLAQLPMSGSRDMDRLGDLVSRLPRHTLYLGTDVGQIPAVIQSVL